MFSPPKRRAIVILASLAAGIAGFADAARAQSGTAEFNRRLAAMQQARNRATPTAPSQAVTTVTEAPPAARSVVQRATAQAPVQQSRQQAEASRIQRTAQIVEDPVFEGGAPLISEEPMMLGSRLRRPLLRRPLIGGRYMMDQPMMEGEVIAEPYMEGEMVVDGCPDGDCGSCGVLGGYFQDGCCDRGGCPPGTPCWLDGLGRIFRNAEYYAGFSSFRGASFVNPNVRTELVDDNSFGSYAGFNMGLPLCRLTCGVLSGQFGLRTVNTNFNGNDFSIDDRNQLFLTAGFYRRVDYGLQFGMVADFLREEWFANSDTVQLRGDLGYVWPSGTTFGFRFATNTQDDIVAGTFNGQNFANMGVTTNENYRFYIRHDAARGGFGEVYGGWTETNQGLLGLDFDMPITERWAFEAGYTWYLDDTPAVAPQVQLGGYPNSAYNAYVGISFRPRGRSHYHNYDRPMFDVADNGSMSIIRN